MANKYFRGQPGSPDRERSIRQLIGRVVDTVTAWARKDGYFRDSGKRSAFSDELKSVLINQRGAFNSPVWFNCGF